MFRSRFRFALAVLIAAGCGDDEPPAPCEEAAPRALARCVQDRAAAEMDCYRATGAECSGPDGALDALRDAVATSCVDGDLAAQTVVAAQERLTAACEAESDSLVWRVVGGPQGAVVAGASEAQASCLAVAFDEANALLGETLDAIDECLGGTCDPAAFATERAALEDGAREAITAACPSLSGAIAVDVATFVERAAHQADCVAATAHESVAPLALSCGPENTDFAAPRGEWTRVRVDGEKWGTLCGDGSGYSFWIRPAPEGEPLDRLFIGLQGGGVCIFEDDCTARLEAAPGLFTAEDDEPLSVALVSDDPEVSPYANWTKVYLPYCTQDVFAGGGVTESLGDLELPRYGSVNLRASLQMVRDWLWQSLDGELAAGGTGYRPAEVRALFGGFSAGSYGTLYNYHWVLDDLQWPRTAAFPDAGLALDNGETLGVAGLGAIKIPVWGMRNNLPPYCFDGDCALGEVIVNALAPRLLQVPEQQMLLLSNQRDSIQQGDAFFEVEGDFVNTLRRTYCDTKDLAGIQWYLTSAPDPVHVVTIQPDLWTGSVDGVEMRDWFERAMSDPSSLTDHAEESDYTTRVDGVEPFPCTVGD
ncbi:MAG: hypothetical protein CMN30_34325 [Sandaracinus sp.]|nr:hypothetical protein [Sandaracinus sp.]|tara:strand:+ start:2167 stop:3939 length:1773 start_codon:yes stop_codon:yes gene_type:complete